MHGPAGEGAVATGCCLTSARGAPARRPWISSHADELAGWVAVAPVGLSLWTPPPTPTKASPAAARALLGSRRCVPLTTQRAVMDADQPAVAHLRRWGTPDATRPARLAAYRWLRLQMKVLAIYGSRDPMRADYSLLEDALPQSQVRRAASLLPGCPVPNCGGAEGWFEPCCRHAEDCGVFLVGPAGCSQPGVRTPGRILALCLQFLLIPDAGHACYLDNPGQLGGGLPLPLQL